MSNPYSQSLPTKRLINITPDQISGIDSLPVERVVFVDDNRKPTDGISASSGYDCFLCAGQSNSEGFAQGIDNNYDYSIVGNIVGANAEKIYFGSMELNC